MDCVISRDSDLPDRVGNESPFRERADDAAIDEALPGGLKNLDIGDGAVGLHMEEKYPDLKMPADAGWEGGRPYGRGNKRP